jgi:hypothetical protein
MKNNMKYVKHDLFAAKDNKLGKLVFKHSYEWVGWYWVTIEHMAQNNGYLEDIEFFCFDYHLNLDGYKEFLEYAIEIGLFYNSDDGYYSKRLLREIKLGAIC